MRLQSSPLIPDINRISYTYTAVSYTHLTAEIAKAKAETEFEKYRVIKDRLFMSDFDKYILELEENVKK